MVAADGKEEKGNKLEAVIQHCVDPVLFASARADTILVETISLFLDISCKKFSAFTMYDVSLSRDA